MRPMAFTRSLRPATSMNTDNRRQFPPCIFRSIDVHLKSSITIPSIGDTERSIETFTHQPRDDRFSIYIRPRHDSWRPCISEHLLLKEYRHAAKLTRHFTIANRLCLTNVISKIIQLRGRSQLQLPISPANGGKLTLAPMIKECIIKLVPLDDCCPFLRWLPSPAQGHRCV